MRQERPYHRSHGPRPAFGPHHTVHAERRRLRIAALHPRPPLPGDNTQVRDAKLIIAARLVRSSELPEVVLGDFKDMEETIATYREEETWNQNSSE